MITESVRQLRGRTEALWRKLLTESGLTPEEPADHTVLLWEDSRLAAAGSRCGNVLKYLAVAPEYRGADLTASVITALRQEAFSCGIRQLFLYTKPENEWFFAPLFFYPVAKTERVLLMENRCGGLQEFLSGLDAPCTEGRIGVVVMHCDPFTKGHRWLIEQASAQCDWLYVFILSEDRGQIPAADRLALVRAGTADLSNVTVHPTGPYLISSATFPTYFLKEKAQAAQVQCGLDLTVFAEHYAPHFGINRRFVGTEPFCSVTRRYNGQLAERLPGYGIALVELPRLELEQVPVSASAVRALLGQGQADAVKRLVPQVTFDYLNDRHLI